MNDNCGKYENLSDKLDVLKNCKMQSKAAIRKSQARFFQDRSTYMLNYKIRYIEHCGHIDDFVFDFDEKFSLLSTFLSSDVTAFEDWIKADFDEVLSGKCARKKFFGNVCGVEISPSTTKLYDNLTDDEESNKTCCEVDTKELRLLIDEWCEKLKDFKK